MNKKQKNKKQKQTKRHYKLNKPQKKKNNT